MSRNIQMRVKSVDYVCFGQPLTVTYIKDKEQLCQRIRDNRIISWMKLRDIQISARMA
jgi:membrane-bound inhibitor of C-type lysozyme